MESKLFEELERLSDALEDKPLGEPIPVTPRTLYTFLMCITSLQMQVNALRREVFAEKKSNGTTSA